MLPGLIPSVSIRATALPVIPSTRDTEPRQQVTTQRVRPPAATLVPGSPRTVDRPIVEIGDPQRAGAADERGLPRAHGHLADDPVRARVDDPERIRVHRCGRRPDRKSTRLNSSHGSISYAVFCLKKKK